MTANPILLQKKYSRVIECFAKQQGLSLDAALDFFYHSQAGAQVDVLPVYETVPAAAHRDEVLQRLEAGTLDAVTFGSSSTVDNFFAQIPADTIRNQPEGKRVKFASIGPVTTKTLAKYGFACDIQPEDFTIPALVKALTAHYEKQGA